MAKDAFDAMFGGAAGETPSPAKTDAFDAVFGSVAKKQPPDTSDPSKFEYDPVSGAYIPLSGTRNVAPGLRRIGEAAAGAYRETPPILTPEGERAVEQGALGPLIGHYLSNPLYKIAGGAMAAGNALFAGAGQLATEATGSPALGRDVTMGLPLLPMFRNPHPNPLQAGPELSPLLHGPGEPLGPYEPALPSPSFIPPNEPHPGPALAPVAEVPAAAPRPAFIPPEGAPESAPGSVGAAGTPTALSNLTPEQAAEYGSVADKQWLYKSLPPGEADTTEYISGISPTMAQREQTTKAAREQKAARNLSPEADQMERTLLDEHNTKRKDFFAETAGSDVTQGIAMRDAEKNIDDGLTRAWRAGGQVDPQPIADAIQTELAAPSGKLPPVKAVMKIVSDALEKSDGTGLETDPRQVYGARRVINLLQSKKGLAENPSYGDPDVQAALIHVKQAIDGAIEPAAPGFTAAIAGYSEARHAIDAQEALQKAEPKLMDAQGRMQFSKFHKFMNDVVQSRDPNAPLNAYQSLTEAQMNRLKSLHDDLMRVATADDLAKARGSDTAPNFIDMAKHALQGIPGSVAAAIAGHAALGPLGAIAGPVAKGTVENMFSRGAERRATRRMQDYLQPDPAKFPTKPNPLLMEGPDNPLQAPPGGGGP